MEALFVCHSWLRSYPRGPLASDGHTNATCSWRVGLWELPELGGDEGEPYLGSSLGSVINLLCDSECDCLLSLRVSVSSNCRMDRGFLLDD